jgi:hypothetical protein
MHFYYIDETGDTGNDLLNAQQPIFVMGGLCISDEKWNPTQQKFASIIDNYFGGAVPTNFELHSHELLSPNGDGPFTGHNRARRNQLAIDILNILVDHSHHIHVIAFCKKTLHASSFNLPLPFDPKNAYLLGFDYLITQFNDHVKYKLGSSARGMIILDKKIQHHVDIENILYDRRFGSVATHRVKWIVEFSYPIDSTKNPMIQIADLVIFCIRKFLEVEHGYATRWTQPAKNFFANCYNIIDKRLTIKRGIIERPEPKLKALNQYILAVALKPAVQWKRKYTITT